MKQGVQLLGSLSNRNKRITGNHYPLMRFSVGDRLMRNDNKVGTVESRSPDSSLVKWDGEKKPEVIKFDPKRTFLFVKEAPAR